MSDNIFTLQMNGDLFDYWDKRDTEGKHLFVYRGGRRSGKTTFIAQLLTIFMHNNGDKINVASMTAEQGRLGAYADFKQIIESCQLFNAYTECLESPREIRSQSGGKVFFNSYKNSETAKGVACDWLFINEANNFTKQQFIDLRANVRKGVFLDYNPNCKFWIDDYVTEDEICDSTWQDNPFLTDAQLEYFAELKAAFESPNATPLDIRNYNVYYLGKYSELRGRIFFESNLQFCDTLPDDLYDFKVFCDPSALRGADYFARVLSAKSRADGKTYIVDVRSQNDGSREDVVRQLREWCGQYDGVEVYVETNGIIGQDFYEYAYNSGIPVYPWYSRGNKFDRICAGYQDIKNNMVFCASAYLPAFMEQVYEFDEKCEHDDNVDALASTYRIQHQ